MIIKKYFQMIFKFIYGHNQFFQFGMDTSKKIKSFTLPSKRKIWFPPYGEEKSRLGMKIPLSQSKEDMGYMKTKTFLIV